MKNRDVLLAKAALVSILLLVAGLSAQSQSPESKSGQWRIAGQNLNFDRGFYGVDRREFAVIPAS